MCAHGEEAAPALWHKLTVIHELFVNCALSDLFHGVNPSVKNVKTSSSKAETQEQQLYCSKK